MPYRPMTKRNIKKTLADEEKSVVQKLEKIDRELYNLGINEYVKYLNSPKRMIWTNLVVGIMRGLGFVLGATVIVALVTIAISYLVGLPIIGDWFGWLADALGNRGF